MKWNIKFSENAVLPSTFGSSTKDFEAVFRSISLKRENESLQ